MTTKIAPDVEAFLRSGIDVPSEAFDRQVRGLLAVARAEKVDAEAISARRPDTKATIALGRALQRLSRASHPRGPRGARSGR